ncbi:beta-lactamase hydrolase domain-containing protein [Luteimonas terricola]|uniref:beta-lactamase hydrolase domain-containing protein n=1 Tax=Luteimonas terricola TaxID=645597 RepID=UPI001FB75EB0|nr:sulfur transferase domain-containing protein [Luteimonas terricola]
MLLAAVAACASPPESSNVQVIEGAKTPAPGVVVTGRLDVDDVAGLRDSGIRHVIDLTLDGETPGFDEAAAVRAQGMGYSNLPVRGAGDLTLDKVQAFDSLLRQSPRPVLVHCASGNRVGAMAALRAAWLEDRPLEDAIAIGRAWGLTGLEDAVRMRIETGPPGNAGP